ncbi:hypothetical protein Bca4012_022370 [Brassica carinata]
MKIKTNSKILKKPKGKQKSRAVEDGECSNNIERINFFYYLGTAAGSHSSTNEAAEVVLGLGTQGRKCNTKGVPSFWIKSLSGLWWGPITNDTVKVSL